MSNCQPEGLFYFLVALKIFKYFAFVINNCKITSSLKKKTTKNQCIGNGNNNVKKKLDEKEGKKKERP